ncbi:MAG: 2-hydroxychromene-2-carboxylate isomerase [Halioglobus sp.]|nr:2-hydroxychromene-2-carboxylate isomerase [Halioglobus sp.]
MTTTPSIEFFYDCSSPWTYFAFTRIIPLTARLHIPITWRPILVGGVFNAVNQDVYAAREKMFNATNSRRLHYYLKDLKDWSHLCGVNVTMPAGHPISSVKAMRGALYAEEQGALIAYSRAVFETYWDSDTPCISSDEVLAGICRQVGLDTQDFLSAIKDQHYKDRLRANTDELIARGGYGSPTIFINGDDMYFGNDRMELIEHSLRDLTNKSR